jgi:hypothetical protein
MKLRFIYVPQWTSDPWDGYYQHGLKAVLHCSLDNGETWQPVECEPFPDEAEQEKRWAATDPRKKDK